MWAVVAVCACRNNSRGQDDDRGRTIGDPYRLNSMTGTVLGGASFMGGIGTMRGAIAGAVIIGVLVNILFFLGTLEPLPKHRRGVNPSCRRTDRAVK